MIDLEQQLTDHLRRRAAAATPSYDLESVEAGLSAYTPVDLDERRRRSPLTLAVAGVAAAVALVVAIAVVRDGDAPSPVTDQDSTPTFVSPRNGFAVRVSSTGGAPRSHRPPSYLGFSEQVEDGFDVVEIGSVDGLQGRFDRVGLDPVTGSRSMNGSTSTSRTTTSCLAAV